MFIPMGLGFNLQKFPIITTVIVSFTIMFSSSMFNKLELFHKEVQTFSKLDEKHKKIEIEKTAIKNQLLTSKNISFSRLLQASFTHANWHHLLSNLFFLFIFGIFVEQKLGALRTLMITVFGSLVGLFSELLISVPTTPVMGLSAGVMAIMGAFVACFYKYKMKFWVYGQVVKLHVIYFVPLFYLIGDLQTVASGSFSNSGIAHFAHITGALFGAALGAIFVFKSEIRYPYLFSKELELVQSLKLESDFCERFKLYQVLFKWNPMNPKTFNQFINDIEKNLNKLNPSEMNFAGKMIKKHYFMNCTNNQQKYEMINFVSKILDLSTLDHLFEKEFWPNLFKITQLAINDQQYKLALYIYPLCIKKIKGFKKQKHIKAYNQLYEYAQNNKGEAA